MKKTVEYSIINDEVHFYVKDDELFNTLSKKVKIVVNKIIYTEDRKAEVVEPNNGKKRKIILL
jgi:hypothetical protein